MYDNHKTNAIKCYTPNVSIGVHSMVLPRHSRLAALQSVHDAVAVAAVDVCVAVFDDPASVWNDYAVIVVTHCMDEDEC